MVRSHDALWGEDPRRTYAARAVNRAVGTIVATSPCMSAQSKSRIARAGEDPHNSATIRRPCPSRAHKNGEVCLVCDEEHDGTISVVVTEAELGVLGAAAGGRPVDVTLSPRLYLLGLLYDVGGLTLPTEQGYSLLGGSFGSVASPN